MMRVLAFIVGAIGLYIAWRLAAMKLKTGVSLENVSWRMFYAAIVAEFVWAKQGAELVITSAADGVHSRLSKHYAVNNESGMVEALDFRSYNLKSPNDAVKDLRAALGSDYDVVLEEDHVHAEYDPEIV